MISVVIFEKLSWVKEVGSFWLKGHKKDKDESVSTLAYAWTLSVGGSFFQIKNQSVTSFI